MDGDCRASDELLWRRARDGDSHAFGMIFDRHANRVYTQCLRRLGSREDADDLVAVTFTEAWRCRSRVRFVDESCLPWLLVVASNHCKKHLRTRAREQRRLADVRPPDPVADIASDVADAVDRQRRVEAVRRAMDALSGPEQVLVSLCDLSELTYAQASVALDIPIGTVRSRLSRAHAKLRLAMRGDQRAVTVKSREHIGTSGDDHA